MPRSFYRAAAAPGPSRLSILASLNQRHLRLLAKLQTASPEEAPAIERKLHTVAARFKAVAGP